MRVPFALVALACISTKVISTMATKETYYSISTLAVQPENLDKVIKQELH